MPKYNPTHDLPYQSFGDMKRSDQQIFHDMLTEDHFAISHWAQNIFVSYLTCIDDNGNEYPDVAYVEFNTLDTKNNYVVTPGDLYHVFDTRFTDVSPYMPEMSAHFKRGDIDYIDYDISDVDRLIQFACFGKIIYA